MEHPFDGSWGYQVSGYYAPTARFGTPDDFRHFVDTLHHRGIGVILDWVPAHFPKDDFALRRFDGTALYEHADPRKGEHQDWGTLIFNYGRNEVRNFLLGNALYWLEEFHIDGLRVDAVASMLYLDYSEHFTMPLSHDEVVHGKGSLLNKMAGDAWQKFANLRLLFAYLYTRPGKKLLFMGSELAPEREWSHERSLDWHLASDPLRAGLMRYLEELGALYKRSACLWQSDSDPAGFRWIECEDRQNSVLSYLRRDGGDSFIVVCNFTPVPREGYRLGVPDASEIATLLSS